jgi:hypothetical protein
VLCDRRRIAGGRSPATASGRGKFRSDIRDVENIDPPLAMSDCNEDPVVNTGMIV